MAVSQTIAVSICFNVRIVYVLISWPNKEFVIDSDSIYSKPYAFVEWQTYTVYMFSYSLYSDCKRF